MAERAIDWDLSVSDLLEGTMVKRGASSKPPSFLGFPYLTHTHRQKKCHQRRGRVLVDTFELRSEAWGLFLALG